MLCKPPLGENVNAIVPYHSSSNFEHHFAVIRCYGTENSERVAVSPSSRFPEGESFRGSIRPTGCFLAADNSENSDDAQGLLVDAAAGRSCQFDGAI
jgi:hypothetical protein